MVEPPVYAKQPPVREAAPLDAYAEQVQASSTSLAKKMEIS
jgi:hypothetical protein